MRILFDESENSVFSGDVRNVFIGSVKECWEESKRRGGVIKIMGMGFEEGDYWDLFGSDERIVDWFIEDGGVDWYWEIGYGERMLLLGRVGVIGNKFVIDDDFGVYDVSNEKGVCVRFNELVIKGRDRCLKINKELDKILKSDGSEECYRERSRIYMELDKKYKEEGE